MKPIRVAVDSTEPMTQAGLTIYLNGRREAIVPVELKDRPDVIVLVSDQLDADAMNRLRRIADKSRRPTVLVVGEVLEAYLLTAVECRVAAILSKNSTTPEQLIDSIIAVARGNGVMSRAVLGKLLRRVEALQREVLVPNGLTATGLKARELHILELIAKGYETAEIAAEMRYSERTVKNVIYEVTTRLNLRNRAHAVAYALRAGMI